ncbi:hypothetical protein [Nocardia transvalensis]|uniref:hypothetical protein n=1 Tax=Nocardia transvalensis TaxID=37333 RepID=UPI001893DBFF|nr:hypothetical protein [Nocardia transvalensis]MBF6332453.1 hypothetical protein [Nocardia transvalensis]
MTPAFPPPDDDAARAAAHAAHPAGTRRARRLEHRGPRRHECLAYRNAIAPLTTGPSGQLGRRESWKIYCILPAGHIGVHTDVSGRRWENI